MRYSCILTALSLACLRTWVSKFNCLVKQFVALYRGSLHSFAVFVRISSVSLRLICTDATLQWCHFNSPNVCWNINRIWQIQILLFRVHSKYRIIHYIWKFATCEEIKMFFCTFVIFVVAKINFLCIPVDLQFIYLPLQETKIGCFMLILQRHSPQYGIFIHRI